MRVLIVGLGDIARKAYLPVVGALPGIELHLATRDRTVLEQVGSTYRIPNLHHSVTEALASSPFDAAFVHVATAAHPQIVEQLLRAGVSVLVDKPLADSLGEASRLVTLSQEVDRLLMVGFNRRYAPTYSALRDGAADFILMQKHRHDQLDEPRRTVFDDFIHVVDTLLALQPARAERVTIETVVDGGRLRSVTLMLASRQHIAVGSMDRASGLDEERLDVICGGQKRSVLNLSERIEQAGGFETRSRRPDWASVADQRGFSAMCAAFLDGVQQRIPTAAEEILETHRLCEEIVRHVEQAGNRQ